MPAPLDIKRLDSGGLITTYRCASRCAHCLYDCGPRRRAAFISPEETARAARTARALGCGSMHVGGGEPFLFPENLRAALIVMRDEGLALDYVETGCSWAGEGRDGEEAAAELLGSLRQDGLHSLLVSISPFHCEWVSLSRTLTVLRAAALAGVRILHWSRDFLDELEAMGPGRHSLADLERRLGPGYVAGLPRRYWVHLGGRALDVYRPHLPRHPADEIARAAPRSCLCLADVGHFHLDLWGNYVPGLCAGLALRAEDLGRPVERERYPLLWLLWNEGVAGLLREARARGFSQRPDGYVTGCDLCTHCRRFLWRAGDYLELAPAGFYRFRDADGRSVEQSLDSPEELK